MKKTLENQSNLKKGGGILTEPENHGGLYIVMDFDEMDLKYLYESDDHLQPISHFKYHVFTEEERDYDLMEKLEKYIKGYQELLSKRGYADSVSYYYSEDDEYKMFHMTPLDDLTMASFPEMCYFILRHEEMDRNDTFVHIIWHKNGAYHVVVKAMDEIDIPNIETKVIDMPLSLTAALSDNGDFQIDVPHDGGEWMSFFDDLSRFAKETEKTPGVVVVARVDGKNRYFKPRKSFS